jgi:predicted RNA-binding Zn-ribbon protein involved in translation (DUF1610 family)
MAKVKHEFCIECEAEFKVRFDMDDERYVVLFCPFCGADIEQEEVMEFPEED